jgi:inosine-uridine nucleoside N-ribohydrolase
MWIDPQAARETLGSPREHSVSLVAVDATRHVPLTAPFAARLQSDQSTPEARLIAAIANHPVSTLGSSVTPAYWWDPLAAIAATRPGSVSYQAERILVIQDGAQAGRTAPAPDGRGVHVGVFADQARFEQVFLDALNGRAA